MVVTNTAGDNCGFNRKLDGVSRYIYMVLATKILTYNALLIAISPLEV